MHARTSGCEKRSRRVFRPLGEAGVQASERGNAGIRDGQNFADGQFAPAAEHSASLSNAA